MELPLERKRQNAKIDLVEARGSGKNLNAFTSFFSMSVSIGMAGKNLVMRRWREVGEGN